MIRYSIRCASVLALVLTLAPANAAEPPRVVASIKPLHAWAAAVMEGAGTPELLLSGGVSPHTHALRPSELRKLREAQLALWVGESYETFLAKPIRGLGAKVRVVEIAAAPGMSLLPLRRGGAWSGSPEGHGHEYGTDGHLWLDPRNATAAARAIAEALADLDGERASLYRRNAEMFAAQMVSLEDRLRQRLAAVAGRPFLVFHDGYQYFERRFGLSALGAVTANPDIRPGARRLKSLRDLVAGSGPTCVFSEPQFDPAAVRTITEGTGARTGTLDPLGADLPQGAQHYALLLEGLADALIACLAEARPNGG